MSLVLRNMQEALAKWNLPHYYELYNDDKLFRCCGTLKDVESVLDLYPGCAVKKVFYPTPPSTVDVPSVTIEDRELPEQKILDQSDLNEINLQ